MSDLVGRLRVAWEWWMGRRQRRSAAWADAIIAALKADPSTVVWKNEVRDCEMVDCRLDDGQPADEIARLTAEVERMRPVVDAALAYVSSRTLSFNDLVRIVAEYRALDAPTTGTVVPNAGTGGMDETIL